MGYQAILPNAVIIDARRHPLGTGYSAFKQLFANGHGYSYDLTELGLYYRDYAETMRHSTQCCRGESCA